MRNIASEIGPIRQCLEAHLSSELSRSILFEALASLEEGLPFEASAFVFTHLARSLRNHLPVQKAEEVLRAVEEKLSETALSAQEGEEEIELDPITVSVELSAETQQLPAVSGPVPVLVLCGPQSRFANRLVLCLGEDRVYAHPVSTIEELRRMIFLWNPLLVVVDAPSSNHLECAEVAEVLGALPNHVVPVVWGAESPWGKALLERIRPLPEKIPPVGLSRSQGIEPLCDLVLSRFRGEPFSP
ncbi:MAG: hypothetical protein RMJ84_01305 [Sandaracinaceae bacterium]|nr:hypothetical protein [Sandaracinaceae bacterium]